MTWRLCGRLWRCDVAHDPTAARPKPLTRGPSTNTASQGHVSLSTKWGWGMGGWDGGKVVVGSKAVIITN